MTDAARAASLGPDACADSPATPPAGEPGEPTCGDTALHLDVSAALHSFGFISRTIST